MAQNSVELKLSSGSSSPFYAKQRTLSPEGKKKKKDIKVDYAQLPASPASGQSPEFLAPAVKEITTPNNPGEEAPLRQ